MFGMAHFQVETPAFDTATTLVEDQCRLTSLLNPEQEQSGSSSVHQPLENSVVHTPQLQESMNQNEWDSEGATRIWRWLHGVQEAICRIRVQQAQQRFREAIENNVGERERLKILDELDEMEDWWIKQVQAGQPVESRIAQWPPDEFVSRARMARHKLWCQGMYQNWYQCDRTGAVHFISKPRGIRYWLMDNNGHHVIIHRD